MTKPIDKSVSWVSVAPEERLKERHLRRGVVLQIPRFLQVSILGGGPFTFNDAAREKKDQWQSLVDQKKE